MEISLALLPAILHVGFFALESLLWGKKSTNKIFRMSETEAQTTKLLAFNQGFYNLFLALAIFIGSYLKGRAGKDVTLIAYGNTLIVYSLVSIVGAGLVLYISSPKLWRGAVLQSGPAALALIPYLLRAFA